MWRNPSQGQDLTESRQDGPHRRTRPFPRFVASAAGVLVGVLIVTAMAPPVSAFVPFGPPYVGQSCYGTTSGVVTDIRVGNTGEGPWTTDNTSGDFGQGQMFATASADQNSELMQTAWISVGGQRFTHGACFVMKSTSGSITYTFTNIQFSVDLSVTCGGTPTGATANYSVYLQGDLWDYSVLKWVFGAGHLDTTLTQSPSSVSCPGPPTTYLHTYTIPTAQVGGSCTGCLALGQYYWFFVTLVVDVKATALSGTGNSALAEIDNLNATLSQIDCKVCG